MFNKQQIIAMLCGVALLTTHLQYARQEQVHSLRGFDYELVKRPYALVYFYEDTKHTHADKQYRCQLRDMNKAISALSRLRRYKESNMRFIKVNIDKDALDNLMKTYAITNLPAYILFKDGVPVRDEQGGIVYLHGFVSTRELQQFIEENIGDDLAQERQQRREDRLLRAEEAAYYWGYPYWGCWGYPYYYNGPCWNRPYVGFGFGYYV